MTVHIKEKSMVDEFLTLLTTYGQLSNEEISSITSVKVNDECITFLKGKEIIELLNYYVIHCKITVTSVITIHIVVEHDNVKLLDITIEA